MKLDLHSSKLEYLVYAVSLGLCFLLFKQSDLTLTNNASLAYLYGHYWDFYDYNKSFFTGNNYLPALYWIFALWNIPLKLMGFAPEITIHTWMLSTKIQTIWSKLLLAIFFLGSIRTIGKISEQIITYSTSNNLDKGAISVKYLFATSPIAIFAVFIFSGYDIFGVYFTLLGLKAYLSKDFKKFTFWFSIAISFKYFAALIYLPLVLMIEKRLIHLLIYGFCGIAFSAIQFLMYWHSEAFHEGIFGMIGNKLGSEKLNTRFVFANLAYGIMCIYLYFSNFKTTDYEYNWCKRVVFVCIVSYALLFSWTLWHPQWLIIITPFICISYLFIRNKESILFIEIFGYLGFTVFCINNWVGNVDNSMIYGGVFADLFPQKIRLANDLIGREWMPLSRTLLYSFLYAAPLLFCYEHYQKNHQNFFKRPFTEINLFKARFLIASYLYVLISFVCIFL